MTTNNEVQPCHRPKQQALCRCTGMIVTTETKIIKLEINMHHLHGAMQYRQAHWAILTKFCVVGGFLSLRSLK